MKLINIEKKYSGNFLSYYIATYLNVENKEKKYEFISRNHKLTINTFGNHEACAVGIIIFSEDRKKILIEKEFRMGCNNYIYNFPAGLIEKNEDIVSAATRELIEETGIEIIEIIDILPEAYVSGATIDETLVTVIAIGKGDIHESDSFDEEISTNWYTKTDVQKLFDNQELMSVRTQLFLYKWMNEGK